jgi:hypothetical protein
VMITLLQCFTKPSPVCPMTLWSHCTVCSNIFWGRVICHFCQGCLLDVHSRWCHQEFHLETCTHTVLDTLLVGPEVDGFLMMFVYVGKAQRICCEIQDLWHVEVALKYCVDVIIKYTGKIILCKACFCIQYK